MKCQCYVQSPPSPRHGQKCVSETHSCSTVSGTLHRLSKIRAQRKAHADMGMQTWAWRHGQFHSEGDCHAVKSDAPAKMLSCQASHKWEQDQPSKSSQELHRLQSGPFHGHRQDGRHADRHSQDAHFYTSRMTRPAWDNCLSGQPVDSRESTLDLTHDAQALSLCKYWPCHIKG